MPLGKQRDFKDLRCLPSSVSEIKRKIHGGLATVIKKEEVI